MLNKRISDHRLQRSKSQHCILHTCHRKQVREKQYCIVHVGVLYLHSSFSLVHVRRNTFLETILLFYDRPMPLNINDPCTQYHENLITIISTYCPRLEEKNQFVASRPTYFRAIFNNSFRFIMIGTSRFITFSRFNFEQLKFVIRTNGRV